MTENDNKTMLVGTLIAYLNKLKAEEKITDQTPIISDYPFFFDYSFDKPPSIYLNVKIENKNQKP